MSEGTARRKGSEGPGWFATLGGAAILIVLGFGVGLVAGAAWEEPELVIDHFSGRTTAVPVEGQAPAGAPPVEVQNAPAESAPLGAPERAPRPAARPARPQVAAPAPVGGDYAIQVGAFGERKPAEGLAGELRSAGFPVYVAEDTGGSARFKVRVGPLAERAEAERLATRLKTEQRLPTWVLSRDPR